MWFYATECKKASRKRKQEDGVEDDEAYGSESSADEQNGDAVEVL